MNTVVHSQVEEDSLVTASYELSHSQALPMGIDPSGWLFQSHADLNAQKSNMLILKGRSQEVIAVAVVEPAELSQFQDLTNLSSAALETTAVLSAIWISPKCSLISLLPVILYIALRQARIIGCQNIAALIPSPNEGLPVATLLHLEPLTNIPTIQYQGKQWVAMGQQLNYSIMKVYENCQDDELKWIQQHFIDEILSIHTQWLDRFFQGSWVKAILNGTMARQQYVSSLYNMHQYVRLTTRLLGRCVAHSEGRDLRNHYLEHLKGEVNHEIIIENDLRSLGVDVEYCIKKHVPNERTKLFMVTQESTIGFYQDPVLMLACPLAAEGISAHLSQRFLDGLYQCIESWGYSEPKKCAGFLRSHTVTDGGDDGHWQAVVNAIQKNIHDELTQQRFLSVLKAAMFSIEQSFNSSIDELLIWSAAPLNT